MDPLQLSPRTTVLPVIHGSGDFAVEVRRIVLDRDYDAVAVPIPEAFREAVERGIERLPIISAAVHRPPRRWQVSDWTPEGASEDEPTRPPATYVPIDPCQPVIAALRIALGERKRRIYLDSNAARFVTTRAILPDPYAVKRLRLERFASAILPLSGRPQSPAYHRRLEIMAHRLRGAEQHAGNILLVCSLLDWPWLKEAYDRVGGQTPGHAAASAVELEQSVGGTLVEDVALFDVDPRTLMFLSGELPFLTGLYEQSRLTLDTDDNLSVDGLKQLLLAARAAYEGELGKQARRVTPQMLSVYMRYARNLALVERRMTPDFYSLVRAAQQIAGDRFAIKLAEQAQTYPFTPPADEPLLHMGIEKARFPDDGPMAGGPGDGHVESMISRLPGHPVQWRALDLIPGPPKVDKSRWQQRWNPFRQCSWPPEDQQIEQFRGSVRDFALSMLGQDLARTEKFTTSLKDGLDMRETLRNFHTGDLYVKVLPPNRGSLDCVVMLFDSPADPRDYPWRITWHAEHQDESTLSLFATDFQKELVGPGIAQASYGGAMFLFPPRPIPDVWDDPRFDFVDTLEERLLVAGCFHSREKHVAVLSGPSPGAAYRRLARVYKKKLLHVPLARFSQERIRQLRTFHVLNGQEIRSYAAYFIRHA